MWLDQRADCAVRLMVDLAGLPEGGWTTVKDVARRQGIPARFMSKVATRAAAAGLVTARRGTGGGLGLARAAETITLLEVVEAVGRPLALTRCTYDPVRCPSSGRCGVMPVWEDAQRQLKGLLAKTTLAEVSAAEREIGTSRQARQE